MDELTCVEYIRFEDAKEFLEYLRPTNSVWEADVFEAPWVFRGQSNAAHPLRPRAWRSFPNGPLKLLHDHLAARLSENPINEMEDNVRRLVRRGGDEVAARDYFVHTATELEAVRQFTERADQLGLHIPSQSPPMTGLQFLHSLRIMNIQHFAPSPAFAFAQHHGIPTRLLDWTRKSLIAAFFALREGGTSAEHDIAVWSFNTSILWDNGRRRDNAPLSILTCPRSQHNFLHAQDGLFLWRPNALDYFIEHHEWPDFEKFIEEAYVHGSPRPLRKITLAARATLDLVVLLWKERVTLDYLMPTYDNAAEALQREWQFAEILTE